MKLTKEATATLRHALQFDPDSWARLLANTTGAPLWKIRRRLLRSWAEHIGELSEQGGGSVTVECPVYLHGVVRVSFTPADFLEG